MREGIRVPSRGQQGNGLVGKDRPAHFLPIEPYRLVKINRGVGVQKQRAGSRRTFGLNLLLLPPRLPVTSTAPAGALRWCIAVSLAIHQAWPLENPPPREGSTSRGHSRCGKKGQASLTAYS